MEEFNIVKGPWEKNKRFKKQNVQETKREILREELTTKSLGDKYNDDDD